MFTSRLARLLSSRIVAGAIGHDEVLRDLADQRGLLLIQFDRDQGGQARFHFVQVDIANLVAHCQVDDGDDFIPDTLPFFVRQIEQLIDPFG